MRLPGTHGHLQLAPAALREDDAGRELDARPWHPGSKPGGDGAWGTTAPSTGPRPDGPQRAQASG